jgi:hypothetical protein
VEEAPALPAIPTIKALRKPVECTYAWTQFGLPFSFPLCTSARKKVTTVCDERCLSSHTHTHTHTHKKESFDNYPTSPLLSSSLIEREKGFKWSCAHKIYLYQHGQDRSGRDRGIYKFVGISLITAISNKLFRGSTWAEERTIHKNKKSKKTHAQSIWICKSDFYREEGVVSLVTPPTML